MIPRYNLSSSPCRVFAGMPPKSSVTEAVIKRSGCEDPGMMFSRAVGFLLTRLSRNARKSEKKDNENKKE